MNTEASLEELLRWRAAIAEAEAPPAPRFSRLLDLTSTSNVLYPLPPDSATDQTVSSRRRHSVLP